MREETHEIQRNLDEANGEQPQELPIPEQVPMVVRMRIVHLLPMFQFQDEMPILALPCILREHIPIFLFREANQGASVQTITMERHGIDRNDQSCETDWNETKKRVGSDA
jgi:hypothetical protein